MAPAPIGVAAATNLIAGLHGAKLSTGMRGRPPRDVRALAELVARVSSIAAELRGRMLELDLNPVVVHAEACGVTVLDALLLQRKPAP